MVWFVADDWREQYVNKINCFKIKYTVGVWLVKQLWYLN